jgi:predicted DNA-binding transcriptional regulator YafY
MPSDVVARVTATKPAICYQRASTSDYLLAYPAERTMQIQNLINKAMRSPDDLVISMEYVDSEGVKSRRIVSPIRFMGPRRFLALCLCREEPRQFVLQRCHDVTLMPAAEVMMPVAMG